RATGTMRNQISGSAQLRPDLILLHSGSLLLQSSNRWVFGNIYHTPNARRSWTWIRSTTRCVADPTHPEHTEYVTWAGDDYEPTDFRRRCVNLELFQMIPTDERLWELLPG
ncbi:MAG: hypothetical protein ACE5PT_13830, partial [Gemmatimonadales bacterium]